MSQPPTEPTSPFLDVPLLLESSQPRARRGWVAPSLAALLLLIVGSAYLSSRSAEWKALVDFFSVVMMLAIVGGMMLLMWKTVRRHREERLRVEAIEELVQLRRWPQAVAMLHASLLQPALTIDGRAQMLLYLATVLARYNRFDDAIAVHNHLLQTIDPDAGTAHALHLSRAMAMLREDHLVDADRAITELRREVNRASTAAQRAGDDVGAPEAAELIISAGLALIEMYRDVKTNHADEAIEMFNRSLPAMRKQMGMRVGDGYGLVAAAFEAKSDEQSARLNWERATLLSPIVELTRRYPELQKIAQKYAPAERPADASADVGLEAA